MPSGRATVKVACRLCHDRRVKCDRSEGVACSNCCNARRVCEPISSRRGRRRKLPILPTGVCPNRSLSETSHNVLFRGTTTSSSTTPPIPTHQTQGDSEERQQEQYFPAVGYDGKAPYVGDSSNLNYLVQQFGVPMADTTDFRPLQDHLHAAMAARLGSSTTQDIKKLHVSTHEDLQKQGVFVIPPKETSQALLDAYFHYSLAALPILDRSRFLTSLEEGSFSYLLLNAIYLAATIYCSDSVISEAGFVSRYTASLTFYQRAKSLFDAGYETDAIATIQATFLICHWWSGILEHKDPWYWLGISAGMAQALGMHREKSYIRLNEKDRKIWRRLWWVLYAMDINLSMLLDRPPHIQGRLCNVSPLSEVDFERNTGSTITETLGDTLNEANIFVINAVQLARTVDRFFAIKFDKDSGHLQDICLEQIALWSSSLPLEFQSLSSSSSIWAILTQLVYQEYRLLLHRSNPGFSINTGPGTPIFEICTEISHTLEMLIANDLIYAAAASIIAPVLSVLSIHLANIRRGDSGVQMLSKHRAHFCMVILDTLQDRFPIVAAVYPFYKSLLKRNFASGHMSDGTKVPENSATGPAMQDGPLQLENESDPNSALPFEGLFDEGPLNSMSPTLPLSSPFGNIFEDIFLGLTSPSTSYGEDGVISPK